MRDTKMYEELLGLESPYLLLPCIVNIFDWENLLRMSDSKNGHHFRLHAIDDSIVSVDQFSDIFSVDFRYVTSALRKVFNLLHSSKYRMSPSF